MTTALKTIQDQIKAELANVRKTVAQPSGFRISTKGKVFTLPDGASSPGPLNVVVLDHRNIHQYFKGVYNPNKPEKPSCFASNKIIADLAPHPDATVPQAENCKDCAQNQWNSSPTGGKGKACKNTVRLAVVPPDAEADTPPFILEISPTGLKSWNMLVANLETMGLIPAQVCVEIAFNPNETYPSLVFSNPRPHDNMEIIWALRERAQAILNTSPAGE